MPTIATGATPAHPQPRPRPTPRTAAGPTSTPVPHGASRPALDSSALEILAADRLAFVRHARRTSRRGADPEDAVQDAALIAIRRADVRGPGAAAWLRTTIRHATLRRARAAPAASLDGLDVPGPHTDIDALLDARAAVAALKPDERRALAALAAGFSYREIAERTGWTYTKVNRCISEGRAAARKATA